MKWLVKAGDPMCRWHVRYGQSGEMHPYSAWYDDGTITINTELLTLLWIRRRP